MSHQKHDIFVGNLSFTTTEEQLFTAFSDIGRVLGVRMVNDAETGKSRGFAFVEFEDPQAALAAIRNMNDYELNGRRLRVNFSNASHLEALASKLGMDLSANANANPSSSASGGAGGGAINKMGMGMQKHHAGKGGGMGGMGGMGGGGMGGAGNAAGAGGATAIADALKALSKAEMYDIVAQFKEIADNAPDDARRILSGHPQLPEAMLFLMSKLDMIKTNLPTPGGVGVSGGSSLIAAMLPPQPPQQASSNGAGGPMPALASSMINIPPPPPPPAVGGAAAAAAAAAVPRDPRARDPRRRDPRMQQQQQPPSAVASAVASAPPPPPPAIGTMYQQQAPPPPPPPAAAPLYHQQQMQVQMQQQQQQQPMMAPSQVVDPGLIQQVMSLTPQQIAQLPAEKQQYLLQLRQQFAQSQGGAGGGR